jgi:hypothetical protein
MKDNSNQSLETADRLADIEKCIGDFAEVFVAMKAAVASIPPPTCPPYCSHNVHKAYPEDLSVEDRVADIKKYVGDYNDFFQALSTALQRMPPPTCPPYCAHGT